MSRSPTSRRQGAVVIAVLGGLVVLAWAGVAMAQGASPFGVGRPDAPPPAAGSDIAAFILARQSEFFRALSEKVASFHSNPWSGFGLIGLSFAYGVFHAAGPGHGKAVISSYLLATDQTLRKGLVLSFAGAMMQAGVAVALVAVMAAVINATARQMDDVALVLERVSFAVIALIGLALLWRKALAFWGLLARRFGWPGATLAPAHGPGCDHAIAPAPERIAGPLSINAALGVVAAIGIRPCTGAILVLVFALSQGVFALGIASTVAMAIGTAATVAAIATIAVAAKGIAVKLAAPGRFGPAVALGLLEVLAAVAITLFGLALFVGASLAGQG